VIARAYRLVAGYTERHMTVMHTHRSATLDSVNMNITECRASSLNAGWDYRMWLPKRRSGASTLNTGWGRT